MPGDDEIRQTVDINEGSDYEPQWDRPLRLIATVFLIIGGLYMMTLLAPVIVMLVVAFILAFAMSKPAAYVFKHTRFSWGISVAFVYVLVIILVVYLLVTLLPNVASELQRLSADLETAYAQFQESAGNYRPQYGVVVIFDVPVDFNFVLEPLMNFLRTPPSIVPMNIAPYPPPVLSSIQVESIDLRAVLENAVNIAGTVTGVFTSLLSSVAGFVSGLLLALFVSFLVLVDLPNTKRALGNNLPQAYHREYGLLIREITHVWNGFFRGQVLIGLVIGLLTWVQLVLMGVPGAVVLSIIVGLISLIPTIGGIIALVPLFSVPLLTGSTVLVELSPLTLALLVIVINLVISQVIWNVVAPVILGDVLDLPLPVIIVGVFVGAAVGGVLGAFLVAPVVSTIRIFVLYLVAKIGQRDPFPGEPLDAPLFMSPKKINARRTVQVPVVPTSTENAS